MGLPCSGALGVAPCGARIHQRRWDLRYLRRRARLTQRELGLAVGYIESHIHRRSARGTGAAAAPGAPCRGAGRAAPPAPTECRVAVCGLPGVGKTTLAAMLARDDKSGTAVCWLTVTAGVTPRRTRSC